MRFPFTQQQADLISLQLCFISKWVAKMQAHLNPADRSLNISISKGEGTTQIAATQNKGAFGYCFGGVRGYVGVYSGRWGFSVKVLEALPVQVVSVGHRRHGTQQTSTRISWENPVACAEDLLKPVGP
jgi:hypothetical protein